MEMILLSFRKYSSKAGIALVELFYLNVKDGYKPSVKTFEESQAEELHLLDQALYLAAGNQVIVGVELETNGFSSTIKKVDVVGSWKIDLLKGKK